MTITLFAVCNTPQEAAERLESLRVDVERLRLNTPDGSEVNLTISIGYCTDVPKPGQASGQWLRMADRAVYEAKRQGRNRVVEVEE